jgi:sensor histidine kinase YesM
VEVTDDGLGLAPEQLAWLNAKGGTRSADGMGIGLQNVHRRLRILFGPGSGLVLASAGKGRGTTCRLTLPAQAQP